MSEITGGGSVVHGALVFLAAVVGIAGYLIRSRLNHIELQKKEEAAQEEERRRDFNIAKINWNCLLVRF